MVEEKKEQYISFMWKTREIISTDVTFSTKIPDTIENQAIFILDEDPILAAQYLTLDLIKKYIEYITYSMIAKFASKAVKEKSGVLKKPRVDYMFANQRTAVWFTRFYNEMQNIYKKLYGRRYIFTEFMKDEWFTKLGVLKPKRNPKNVEMVTFVHPDCYYNTYKIIYEPYKTVLYQFHMSSVAKFRLMLIIMGYLNNEFPFGAPAWYNCSRVTIWKSFNKMTRLYYRIDTNVDGVYKYFYSVDNNSWTEIKNVPLAMRHLIDGIIFARET